MTDSTPKKDSTQSFGLGLFIGTVAGIASYYLFNTPKGRELKAEIIDQYSRHKDHFQADVDQFFKEHPLPKTVTSASPSPEETSRHQEDSASIIAKITALFKPAKDPTTAAAAPKKKVFTKSGKKLS